MDLTNRTEIKNLLEKYGARPEKYLGQHFLLSKRALRQMIVAAEIKKGDIVVEVGPGLGVLTRELAKTGAMIVAIEKDNIMISILKETLKDYKNVFVIQADAREIDWSSLSTLYPQKYRFTKSILLGERMKIVANLPYNIANFLIRSWLEAKNQPERMVVTVQKEVARRICASPPHSKMSVGARPPHMNLLAASVQFYANAKIVNYVPAEVFWPKPKVDSAILSLVPYREGRNNPHVRIIATQKDENDELFKKRFFEILKAGFSQPRKQLAGNLVKKLKIPREKLLEIFKSLNIPEKSRAENLTIENWIEFVKSLRV